MYKVHVGDNIQPGWTTTEVFRPTCRTTRAGQSRAMASASRRRHGFDVVEALDREWRELDRRHPGTVSRWADRHDVLASCRSFDDVLSAARLCSDPVLAALLTEVSMGDQLAGRVALQALIGRMVRMAQRDPRAGTDDYLARLWCAINSYPLHKRPARIAANLSMDTLKAVSREHRWIGRGDVTLWPSSESLEELLSPAGLDGVVAFRRRPLTSKRAGYSRPPVLATDRPSCCRSAAERLCRRHDRRSGRTEVAYQRGYGSRPVLQGSPRAGCACS